MQQGIAEVQGRATRKRVADKGQGRAALVALDSLVVVSLIRRDPSFRVKMSLLIMQKK
jgi:hypothetical protein